MWKVAIGGGLVGCREQVAARRRRRSTRTRLWHVGGDRRHVASRGRVYSVAYLKMSYEPQNSIGALGAIFSVLLGIDI